MDGRKLRFSFRERLPFLSERALLSIEACLWEFEAKWYAGAYDEPPGERSWAEGRDEIRIFGDVYSVFATEIATEVGLTEERLETFIPEVALGAIIEGGWILQYANRPTMPNDKYTEQIGKYYLFPSEFSKHVKYLFRGAISQWRAVIVRSRLSTHSPENGHSDSNGTVRRLRRQAKPTITRERFDDFWTKVCDLAQQDLSQGHYFAEVLDYSRETLGKFLNETLDTRSPAARKFGQAIADGPEKFVKLFRDKQLLAGPPR